MKYVLSLFLLLTGCASTYKVNQFHADTSFEKGYFKGKKLLIAPLAMEITSVANGSAKLDSGKESLYLCKDSLGRVFNHGFRDRFDGEFRDVQLLKDGPETGKYDSILTAANLVESVDFYDDKRVEYYFKHPKREALESLGIKTDVIIFISGMLVQIHDIQFEKGGGGGSFGTAMTGMGPSGPTMQTTFTPGGGSTEVVKVPRMNVFAKFIIWDYGKDAAVAYGQFQMDSGVDADAVQSRWSIIRNDIASRILANAGKLR